MHLLETENLSPSSPPRHKSRFHLNLVELLVVLGILAILISFLLPTMMDSLYRARRLACSGHLKQIYIAAGTYADDYYNFLPGQGYGQYSPSTYYNQGGVLNFIDDYCGTPIDWSSKSFADPTSKGIVGCPASKSDWLDYWLAAFGPPGYNPLGVDAREVWAHTRFDRMGGEGPNGPVSFAFDYTYIGNLNFPDHPLAKPNDHGHVPSNPQGMNVMATDGSFKWLDLPMLGSSGNFPNPGAVVDYSTYQVAIPRGYYTLHWAPMYWRVNSDGYTNQGDTNAAVRKQIWGF